jgi:hypothetical protein
LKALFEDRDRDFLGSRENRESWFAYLNRSTRPEMQIVREELERWYVNFLNLTNKKAAQELWSNFTSKDTPNQDGAFFELFIHELLLRLNHHVLSVHPETAVTNKSTHPDFLVNTPSGQQFYLEVTVKQDDYEDPRFNRALDLLNQLPSRYYIHVEIERRPTTEISKKSLRSYLEVICDQADLFFRENPEEYSFSATPYRSTEDENIELIFELTPKPDSVSRSPSAWSYGHGMYSPNGMGLRKVLFKKAKKYGNLEKPFIIAVNSLETFARQDHIFEALFGTEAIIKYPHYPPQFIRQNDGLWTNSKNSPTYTRVSGVLYVEKLLPHSVSRTKTILCRNPWAKYPLPDDCLDKLPQVLVEVNTLRHIEGLSLHSIFNLPTNWPED